MIDQFNKRLDEFTFNKNIVKIVLIKLHCTIHSKLLFKNFLLSLLKKSRALN